MCQLVEWYERNALRMKKSPSSSVTNPVQSRHDQLERHARTRLVPQSRNSHARRRTAGSTASWLRTSGAKALAATAPQTQPRRRVSSAFAIR